MTLPFINWRSVPPTMPGPKPRKVPWCTVTGGPIDHLDPANWLDAATAVARAGGDVHVGQVLPREPSGYFLIDLDNCRDPATGAVQAWAAGVMSAFSGAFAEVSHSGTGLHIMGRCDPARVGDRRHKWTPEGAPHNAAEFYHAGRFIACGHGGTGDVERDCTDALLRIVPEREPEVALPLVGGPAADYNGPADDDALLDLMRTERNRRGGDLAPGLYAIDFFTSIDRLRALIHATQGGKDPTKPAPWDFDGSSADMALMNHLAYYTGCDVPRMVRLHARSVMGQRPKALDRPQYVTDTAQRAARGKMQSGQYMKARPASVDTVSALLEKIQADPHAAPTKLAGDVAALSEADRERVLAECRHYGIKQAMQAAVKQVITDQRRAATIERGLVADDKGNPIPNMENVRRILLTEPAWQGTFAVNEFDGAVWRLRPTAGRMTDNDPLTVMSAIQSGPFPSIGLETVRQAITGAAMVASFHPVRDYLSGLVWDGAGRLSGLFTDYFPCAWATHDELEYLRQVGRKFAIGAVARVMQPGCKVDTMPVIAGEQGQKKSSGLAALTGVEWYGNDMPDMTLKDAKEWLRGKWVAEIGELSAMRGKDIEHVKNFLTTTHDSYRKAYGHVTETIARQTVFAGTTNTDEYLSDETGNRRFWPVKMLPGAAVDVRRIASERGQIWAEAVAAYHAGERWWFDEGENRTLRQMQESARTVDIDETRVADWLRYTDGAVTASQVAAAVFPDAPGNKGTSMRVARYLAAAGWAKSGMVNGVNRWARTERAAPYERPVGIGNITRVRP
jgi:hypothetical protein